ncbi:copper homeostasis protein cutC homolog [Condylostylus longicornis]|uniref:copper homeostasis protein cutC homolog n=1 Tax=Condylostylus longicornis TaxID=2530218 RepID=UPI00244E34DC|nr:copper homeostasis protein cutC homolog [Condylostylus longicornis]
MLEVCVDSLESAFAAVEGGCSRIELCSALSEGGLTPSPGVLKVLKSQTNIPIFCMLRPRGGWDFQYSDDEITAILHDIEILSSLGADGFVFGALDKHGEVEVEQCKTIIRKCGKNVSVTFHRAFDFTNPKNMITNLELLENLGFSRVLTSGFEETVELGLENIKEMSTWSKDKNLIILPGSGINEKNLEKILFQTNLTEFHSSAKRKKSHLHGTLTGSGIKSENQDVYVTDATIVQKLVKIIDNFKVRNTL